MVDNTTSGEGGNVTVTTGYAQQAGGRLKLKVQATGPGGFDRLVAPSGAVEVAGTLTVARVGSTALPGGTLVVVSGTSRQGTLTP